MLNSSLPPVATSSTYCPKDLPISMARPLELSATIGTRQKHRVFTLTLSAPTDTPPTEPNEFQRLRKLLKALLRTYGLTCIDIQEQDVGCDRAKRRTAGDGGGADFV